MNKVNIGQKLIATIKQLYTRASSAVLSQKTVREWFHTSVGVRQSCLISPALFNVFLGRIMTDALEGHSCSISIGGRTISNHRFADEIDGLAKRNLPILCTVWTKHHPSTAWRSALRRQNSWLTAMIQSKLISLSVVMNWKLWTSSSILELLLVVRGGL